mgnify:CR=1 FL=1
MSEATMKRLNLGFRFVLEMLVLVALFLFGLGLSDEPLIAVPLALMLPALVMIVWGLFVAPKASRRLEDPVRLVVELLIWFVGVLAFGFAVGWILAILFGMAVFINLGLMFYWGQRGA